MNENENTQSNHFELKQSLKFILKFDIKKKETFKLTVCV